MKKSIIINIVLLLLSGTGFTQCADGGLKIQSADCEDPVNLIVTDLSCKSLKVKWHANKSQSFIVKTEFTDPVTNNITEGAAIRIQCDNNADCGTTIAVREGAVVSWSVQAVCSVEGIIIYSTAVAGPDAHLPFCRKIVSTTGLNSVHVYPNPSANYLNVELSGESRGNLKFRILDISGKEVFNKAPGAGARTGKAKSYYKLDVRNLIAGTYLLEVQNNNKVNQVKIVLLKK